MIVLFTNKGYITRFGFSEQGEKAMKFWRQKSAHRKAIKVMRTGDVTFITFHSI